MYKSERKLSHHCKKGIYNNKPFLIFQQMVTCYLLKKVQILSINLLFSFYLNNLVCVLKGEEGGVTIPCAPGTALLSPSQSRVSYSVVSRYTI